MRDIELEVLLGFLGVQEAVERSWRTRPYLDLEKRLAAGFHFNFNEFISCHAGCGIGMVYVYQCLNETVIGKGSFILHFMG